MFDRYLRRIAACHSLDAAAFTPWFVAGLRVGRVHRERLAKLLAPPTPFVLRAAGLELQGDDFAARSAAMAEVVARLARAGECRAPTGEMYPVLADGRGEPWLRIDRAAVPWFGVHAFGVHLNGFVRRATGLEIWVARRSRGKTTWPGHLDNLVAGGQAFGMTPMATLQKEGEEEAGLPAAMSAHAQPVGELRYAHQDGLSCKADTLSCFDLELPADFVPRAVDGEVEEFHAWPAARVAASLCGDDPWKPNCAMVALHFLLRHGALDAELDAAERVRLWRAMQPS